MRYAQFFTPAVCRESGAGRAVVTEAPRGRACAARRVLRSAPAGLDRDDARGLGDGPVDSLPGSRADDAVLLHPGGHQARAADCERGRNQVLPPGLLCVGPAALRHQPRLRRHRCHGVCRDCRRDERAQRRNAIRSLLVGVALVACGLAFKIAAVPFHAWAPDVYQGAERPGRGVPVRRLEGRGPCCVGAGVVGGLRGRSSASSRTSWWGLRRCRSSSEACSPCRSRT